MALKYDLKDAASNLRIVGGVAAFDPVTLQIAFTRVAEEGFGSHLPTQIKQSLPPTLAGLSTVAVERRGASVSVTCTIDTNVLTWDPNLRKPVRTTFTGYDDARHYGVNLGPGPVLTTPELMLTVASMRTKQSRPIAVWFAEVADEFKSLDSIDLLETVQGWMALFNSSRKSLERVDEVIIPAQKLKYQSKYDGYRIDGVPSQVKQKFAAALDESGARVVAQTQIAATGAPMQEIRIPVRKIFGERGPVLFWFTEDANSLPFSMIYTTASAWLDPDAHVDLRSISLDGDAVSPPFRAPSKRRGIVDRFKDLLGRK